MCRNTVLACGRMMKSKQATEKDWVLVLVYFIFFTMDKVDLRLTDDKHALRMGTIFIDP